MAIIATPPARRAVKEFTITQVAFTSGPTVAARVRMLDDQGAVVGQTVDLDIRAAAQQGIRFAANGEPEGFTTTAVANAPAGAFAAFVGAAGAFAAKAAALEAWMQANGLLPS